MQDCFDDSLVALDTLDHLDVWESAKVSHKRVFALLTPEIRSSKMAQMLQKPVFALPGCQRMSVNTLLCDTLGMAECGLSHQHRTCLGAYVSHKNCYLMLVRSSVVGDAVVVAASLLLTVFVWWSNLLRQMLLLLHLLLQ